MCRSIKWNQSDTLITVKFCHVTSIGKASHHKTRYTSQAPIQPLTGFRRWKDPLVNQFWKVIGLWWSILFVISAMILFELILDIWDLRPGLELDNSTNKNLFLINPIIVWEVQQKFTCKLPGAFCIVCEEYTLTLNSSY